VFLRVSSWIILSDFASQSVRPILDTSIFLQLNLKVFTQEIGIEKLQTSTIAEYGIT